MEDKKVLNAEELEKVTGGLLDDGLIPVAAMPEEEPEKPEEPIIVTDESVSAHGCNM